MAKSLPVLYSFRRCPYAMRARMALIIARQSCEIREVVLRDKPADLILASPKATVPVLLLEDGNVVAESINIMHWALGISDPEAWLDSAKDPIIVENDTTFKYHLDRYKYPNRFESDAEEHREHGLAFLKRLNERLASTINLSRTSRSITDIAILPFVRQFSATDRRWFEEQPLPHLQSWLLQHNDSALFRQAMLKLSPWQKDAPTTLLQLDEVS